MKAWKGRKSGGHGRRTSRSHGFPVWKTCMYVVCSPAKKKEVRAPPKCRDFKSSTARGQGLDAHIVKKNEINSKFSLF